jgi:hypothetical protein
MAEAARRGHAEPAKHEGRTWKLSRVRTALIAKLMQATIQETS